MIQNESHYNNFINSNPNSNNTSNYHSKTFSNQKFVSVNKDSHFDQSKDQPT